MILDWYYIVEVNLLTIVVTVHTVALILLRRLKCSFRMVQVFLIMLHIIEYCELTMALFIYTCFTEIFIVFTYFFIMLILTADRLLIFY